MRILFLCFMIFSSIGWAKDQNVVAVIGTGPAGLAAASMCQEMGYQTIVFGPKMEPPLEDSAGFWPGIVSPKWSAIIKNMRDSFGKAGGSLVASQVSDISKEGDNFIVSSGKESYSVKAVIIATGKKPSSSFSYPKSDRILNTIWTGKIFSPKDSVIIIGHGIPLFYACLNAAKTAGQVFVFPYPTNDPTIAPLAKILPSLSITWNVTAFDIGTLRGKAFINYFQGRSKLYKEASYIIVAEEKESASNLVAALCSLDSLGAIVTANDTDETSLPGLYACGEVNRNEVMTGVQAAADGQKAGLAVAHFLVNKGIAPQKQPLAPPPPPPPPPKIEEAPEGTTGAEK